jgi:hypothetical protein
MHRVGAAQSLSQQQELLLRRSQRTREFAAGILAQNDHSRPLNCLIRDISDHGAQIRVNAAQPVLEPCYMINLRTRSGYEAHAVWRLGSLTGLRLGKEYVITDSLPAHLEFLRSLFTQAKLRQVDQLISEGVEIMAALHRCGVTEDFYHRGCGIFLH